MPFCTNCGTQVSGQAGYCHQCGARQARGSMYADPISRMSDRTASILCYIPVFGVIPAIVFLAAQRYRLNAKVRFDAFQSLYLFVAYLVVSSVLPMILWLSFHTHAFFLFVGPLKVAIFIIWVYLLVKAAQEQQVHLPVIGDLAARSAAEQL